MAGRITELDGIRGLAILLVLIWHYGHETFSFAIGSWQSYLLAGTTRLSWSGVDLFFVLSGFLIGGILYDAKGSRNYYRAFYGRRIYRIFPVYFIWIALFLAGLFVVDGHSSSSFRDIFNHDLNVWTYPAFLQNFSMASRQTFGPAWMGVTWSLAIEEQFYLLLPLLVRNLSYRGIVWLAVSAIVLAPVTRLAMLLSGNVFYGQYVLLPSRADALALGLLVALACRNEKAWTWLNSRLRHLYWALLLLGCGFPALIVLQKRRSLEETFRSGLYIGGLTWIAVFYALLLLLAVINRGRLETAWLRNKALVKLGTVAYAVYILHFGVNKMFRAAILGSQTTNSNYSSMAITSLSLVTVMLLAALSWRFMEKPLIRHAHGTYRYGAAKEDGSEASSRFVEAEASSRLAER